MAVAVDYGRQRHLLGQANSIIGEVRSSSLEPEALKATYPRVVELCRIVKRFIDSANGLPPDCDGTRAMWTQRGQWLQEE